MSPLPNVPFQPYVAPPPATVALDPGERAMNIIKIAFLIAILAMAVFGNSIAESEATSSLPLTSHQS